MLYSKAFSPISVIGGILHPFGKVHKRNVAPMCSTKGNSTFCSPSHLKNATDPMQVTVFGISK